jgi:hypothetical protein
VEDDHEAPASRSSSPSTRACSVVHAAKVNAPRVIKARIDGRPARRHAQRRLHPLVVAGRRRRGGRVEARAAAAAAAHRALLEEYRGRYFENDGTPGIVLDAGGTTPTKVQRDELLESWGTATRAAPETKGKPGLIWGSVKASSSSRRRCRGAGGRARPRWSRSTSRAPGGSTRRTCSTRRSGGGRCRSQRRGVGRPLPALLDARAVPPRRARDQRRPRHLPRPASVRPLRRRRAAARRHHDDRVDDPRARPGRRDEPERGPRKIGLPPRPGGEKFQETPVGGAPNAGGNEPGSAG